MDEREEFLLRIGKLFVERERAIEAVTAERQRREEAEARLQQLEETALRAAEHSRVVDREA